MNTFEFNQLNTLLESKSGLIFDQSRSYWLDQALKTRMKKTKTVSFQKYLKLLNHFVDGTQELSALIPLVTIGETYFFRNPNHLKALTDYIIPELARNKSKINILSAGCSTGEEPYTLSMLLKEKFPFLDFQITAMDIDSQAISKAKAGQYNERSLMKVSILYRNKYFKTSGNNFILSPDIINSVIFRTANLYDSSFYDKAGFFDLISCQNVLIYFSSDTFKKIVSKFRSVIVDDGFLLLGHSETLRGISKEFELLEKSSSFFYRPVADKPLVSNVVNKTNFSIIDKTAVLNNLAVQPDNLICEVQPVSDDKLNLKKTIDVINLQIEYNKALKYLVDERIDKAYTIFNVILDHYPDDLQTQVAIALIEANRGNTENAHAYCRQIIKLDEFSFQAYYITGLGYEYCCQNKNAKNAYWKSLFLKNNFTPAHYKLAELNYGLHFYKDAKKSYENTLKYLDHESNDIIKLYFGGFSKTNVKNMCKTKITIILNSESQERNG